MIPERVLDGVMASRMGALGRDGMASRMGAQGKVRWDLYIVGLVSCGLCFSGMRMNQFCSLVTGGVGLII